MQGIIEDQRLFAVRIFVFCHSWPFQLPITIETVVIFSDLKILSRVIVTLGFTSIIVYNIRTEQTGNLFGIKQHTVHCITTVYQ